MRNGRLSAVVQATTGVGAVAVVVATIAAVGRGRPGTTYGGASISFGALEAAVALGLLAAALVLLAERSTVWLGTLVAGTTVVWLSPLWVGWEGGPSLVRQAGLVVAPMLPAAVLAVATAIPPAAPSPARRNVLIALVGGLILVLAALSVGLVLARDPLRDLHCWSDCTVSPVLAHDNLRFAHRLRPAVLGLGGATAAFAALVSLVRLGRSGRANRRPSRPALAGTALAGLALAAYSAALLADARELPSRPLYGALFVARAVAFLGLVTGLAWLALRPRFVRAQVTRLAVDLERSATAGGLGQLLARTLGDATLRLLYPIGGGDRVVDAEGRTALPETATGRATPLVGDEGVVALVESLETSVHALERELGPAAQLALGNERLRAEALARLDDVTASRARIVETADTARQRMERDLHDGAQQRMLALMYDLRVALAIAEASELETASVPLRTALARATAAAQELRDIASGIFPAALTASGLAAAVESLADIHRIKLSVRLSPGRRYRSDVETAAYAVVAEAAAERDSLAVTLADADGNLHLTLEADAGWDDKLVWLEDRVGAAGGTVTVSGRRLVAILPLSAAHVSER